MAKISLLPPAEPTTGTESVPMIQETSPGVFETVQMPLTEMVADAVRPTQAELIAAILLAVVNGAGITLTPDEEAGTVEVAVDEAVIATRTFVNDTIAALVGAAPSTLDQINELAAAIGNDPNFAVTLAASLAGKQPLHATLTAIAALATTAFGRGLLTLADAAALAALTGASKYRFGGSVEGTTPAAGDVLMRHVFQNAVTFADDFAGCVARLAPGGANPAADQVLAIKYDGASVGTLTVSTTGVITWVTTAGALACAAGHELRLEAPAAAPAAQLVGLSWTFSGTETV